MFFNFPCHFYLIKDLVYLKIYYLITLKMVNWSSRIRLLFLLIILFVWLLIRAILENNLNMVLFWGIFTLIYIVSLVIFYYFLKRSEN